MQSRLRCSMESIMKFDRRRFIILGGGAVVAVSGVSVLTRSGCSGVKRDDLEADGAEAALEARLGPERYSVLHHGSLAPSPHNTQPWFVKIITKDRWIIGADQTRGMKETDPDNYRLMLAVGAFIENLDIAAGAMGFATDIELLTDDFFAEDIAVVNLRKSEERPYPLELLRSRKTLKKGFLDKSIDDQDIAKLQAPLEKHLFYFPRDTWHSDCLRDETLKAFQAWLDSGAAQAENTEWVRVSNRKARRLRDGLTTEGMEIDGPVGFFVRTVFSDEDFAGDYMKKESMKFTRTIAHEGAGFAVITGYGRTVAGMIETGRRFERMALQARELGIGVQPMTQMLEMQYGLDVIGAEHSDEVDPQMVLRIGYVEDYSEPVSLRRPVSWFVREA